MYAVGGERLVGSHREHDLGRSAQDGLQEQPATTMVKNNTGTRNQGGEVDVLPDLDVRGLIAESRWVQIASDCESGWGIEQGEGAEYPVEQIAGLRVELCAQRGNDRAVGLGCSSGIGTHPEGVRGCGMGGVPHGRVEWDDEGVTVRADRPRHSEVVAERRQRVVKQPGPNDGPRDGDGDNGDGNACLLRCPDGSEVDFVADNEVRTRQIGTDRGSRGTRGIAGKVTCDDRQLVFDIDRRQGSNLVCKLASLIRSPSDGAVDLAGSVLCRRGAPSQRELMAGGSEGSMQGNLRMQMTGPADEGAYDAHSGTLSG